MASSRSLKRYKRQKDSKSLFVEKFRKLHALYTHSAWPRNIKHYPKLPMSLRFLVLNRMIYHLKIFLLKVFDIEFLYKHPRRNISVFCLAVFCYMSDMFVSASHEKWFPGPVKGMWLARSMSTSQRRWYHRCFVAWVTFPVLSKNVAPRHCFQEQAALFNTNALAMHVMSFSPLAWSV